MNNKYLLIICFCLLLFVLVSFYFNWQEKENYSVVYLSTGEIYIGKLSYFPKLTLTDAYLLQVLKDPSDSTKNTFQLAPLSEALWSPERIYLNREQVIFSGPMNESSKAFQAIKNGTSVPK